MASEKTEALVLRLVEFSETSLILTLMTRDFGKLSVIAKGARRPKSSSEGALDLLASCRVVLIRKPGETLDLLTEAKLERRFRAGERDLRRLYAGYYVAEMLRELTDENDPAPELFDLASLTLVQLDADTEVDACLLRFEIQLLRLVGQMPTLESCATCGTRLELPDAEADSARIPFGWQAGGLLCGRCRGSARGVALVRGSSLRWIRQARAATTGPPPPLRTTEAGELRGLFNHYLTHLTGGPPRMRPFITGRSH